jgi:hypothetical protein
MYAMYVHVNCKQWSVRPTNRQTDYISNSGGVLAKKLYTFNKKPEKWRGFH